ncbi:MAG: nitrite reductase small subunit NirD [Bacteroidota bacterium]
MIEEVNTRYESVGEDEVAVWEKVADVADFPVNGGLAFYYKGLQVAVFNFSRRGEWYATQNLCPHKKQMILSRGMIGSENGIPKVACPFHKKTFSLETGENLNGNECQLATYPVRIVNDAVLVGFKA